MEREIDSDFQARNIVYVYHRRELEFCQYDVYLAFFVKVSKWKKKKPSKFCFLPWKKDFKRLGGSRLALALPVEDIDENVLNCQRILRKFFHHQQTLSQRGLGESQEAR